MIIAKLEVIQEDIDRGQRGKAHSCPVAMALGRIFPNCLITVGTMNAIVSNNHNGEFSVFHMPPIAETFVRNFDMEIPTIPFNVDLVSTNEW